MSRTFALARPALPLLAGAALLMTASAWADGPFPGSLSQADQQALAQHDTRIEQFVHNARQHADAADQAVLARLFQGKAVEVAPGKVAGDWRCRSIQMSQTPDLPVVVYRDFRCRITDDGAGLRLTKLTGSQRTAGTFYDVGAHRLGYAGALALGEDKRAPRYGQQPERDQVGYLVPLSATHLRLELQQASRPGAFEILELRR